MILCKCGKVSNREATVAYNVNSYPGIELKYTQISLDSPLLCYPVVARSIQLTFAHFSIYC